MNFIKNNKLKIFGLCIFIIILCSLFTKSFGAEIKSVDFKYAKVNVKCLNIRCGPGVNYNKIGKIYKDDYIEVFAEIGDWYVIKTDNNYIGTVYKKYIDVVDEKEYMNNVKENKNDFISEQTLGEEENKIIEEVIETNKDIIESEEIILNVANIEFGESGELTEDERDFLNLINANRENNGLPKLEIDKELQNVARLKAKDIVDNNYFAHVSPIYGDINAMLSDFKINYKTVGENIAGNNNLVGAVEAWMNSESHRENLLSNNYNYTGVAVVESELYGKVFVQIFVGK